MVAVIQSISRQTMRECTSIADFDERFSARLSAFSRSLDGLIANGWRGMNVFQLIQAQLQDFGIQYTTQISVSGPDLELMPEAAHNIGLALHELATNAVKYGCLSVPHGHVELTWRLAVVDGQDRFLMSWTEADGPRVTAPTHRGFGHQIIERLPAIALAGKATYEFPATGVKWTINARIGNCCQLTDCPG
jgi:two-component sensor histidine kinase